MTEIYLNGEICDDEWGEVLTSYDYSAIYPKAVRKALDDADGDDLLITLTSNGGSVIDGTVIKDMINAYKGNVTIRISGMSASAGTYMAMAADKTIITEGSILMIHRVSSFTSGNRNDMQRSIEMLDEFDRTVAEMYASKTGKTVEEIIDLMDSEAYMSASRAVELGFCDEIEKVGRAAKEPPAKNIVNNIDVRNKRIEILNKRMQLLRRG